MKKDRKREKPVNNFYSVKSVSIVARSARGDLTLYERLKWQMHYRCARAVLGARASEKVSLL